MQFCVVNYFTPLLSPKTTGITLSHPTHANQQFIFPPLLTDARYATAKCRVGGSAGIFTAAVMEYLAAEVAGWRVGRVVEVGRSRVC